MNHTDAAKASKYNVSWRRVKPDLQEAYDGASNSFFYSTILNGTTTVDRKPGRGSSTKDDWEPVENGYFSELIETWKANKEDRGLVIEKPWDRACFDSPVHRAMRTTKQGEWMLRTDAGETWISSNSRKWLYKNTAGVFKQYDGWEPVLEDHVFAKIPLTGPGGYNLVDYDFVDGKAIPKVEDKPKAKAKYKNPTAPPSTVLPETITAAGMIVQTLGEALKNCNKEDQKRLVDEMLNLSRSVSWHLREDRAKWQK